MSTKLHASGLSLIELILAMGILAMIATAGITALFHSINITRLSIDETKASLFAQEGIEAVQSIRNLAWTNLAVGTYGVSPTSGSWQFSGTSNTDGKFIRTLTLSTVNRNCSRLVVSSDGILDTDTFKLVSEVTWSPSPTRNNVTTLTTYLTNFRKLWNAAVQLDSIDLSGAQSGLRIKISGCYAYVLRNAGTNDLEIIDISDPSDSNVVGGISLDETGTDIAVSGSYAYIASNSNTEELQIVDISNPASPTLAGSFNLSGSDNMLGIYAVGTTAYLTRTVGPNEEFYIVNASNPASPSLTGSLQIDDAPHGVYVSGSYAYLASASNTQELQVVDISTPASPSITGSLALTDNDNALTVDGFENLVVIGRAGGLLHTIDITTPSSPLEHGSYSSGSSDINDLAVGHSGLLAFLATSNTSADFQIVNLSTPASPSLYKSFDTADVLYGAGYDSNRDLAAAVGEDNATEFIVWGPR